MPSARIVVNLNEPIGRIAPELYGHFAEHLGACVDEGLWVGEASPIPNIDGLRRDIVEALRMISPPVLRWPGGCFADDYHWEDGVGPRQRRPRTVNLWWGQTIEKNHFGTHEFIRLCELLDCRPYISGNVGTGTPREMRNWVEYCNFAGDSALARRRAENGSPYPLNVRFWGVGNEAWGCGGNFGPEEYAAEYRRFANSLHDMGTPLYLIACGPNGNDPEWTRRFFAKLGEFKRIHGFAAHYYTWNREGQYGTAAEFTMDQWYGLLAGAMRVEALIQQQRALMDEFDPQRKIGLLIDEWGAWHPPAPGRNPSHLWQQNTLRDALVAAITLDTFNRHADKLAMCNIAQLVNVLQALVLTEHDRMLLTPTYHVFDMYQSHQDGLSVKVDVETEKVGDPPVPALSGSASLAGGQLTLTIVNSSADQPVEASIDLRGARCGHISATTLTHTDLRAHNTFNQPHQIAPLQTEIPSPVGEWYHVCPAASVIVFRARLLE